jgi:peptide/nickel transport system permease protein
MMIKENYHFLFMGKPYLALSPGIAIVLIVIAFNFIGNGLSDAANVRNQH